MKIRSSLIISNILMVFVPVAIGIFIGIFGITYIDKQYMYTLNEFFEDENAVVSAKSMIYAYQQEIWSTDWQGQEDMQESGEAENIEISDLNDKQRNMNQSVRMTDLGTTLSRMGYHFAVFMNGDCQYSDMNATDRRVIENTVTDSLAAADSITIGQNDHSIIKSTFRKNGMVCEILAINYGNQSDGGSTVSDLKGAILNLLYLLAIVVVAVILLMNLLLSGWISRSILKPLLALRRGMDQIMEGNLDVSIIRGKSRNSRNEIEEVCSGFDGMRKYLRESAVERVENEEKRREMISGISHDLRTPLTAIEGYVEGILSGIASTPQMKRNYLEAIYHRSKDIERLTDCLSYYNRSGHKGENNITERVEITALLKSCSVDYEPEIGNGQLVIKIHSEEKEPLFLMADVRELKRVFDNLISNSVKYCEKNNCVIDIGIRKNGKNAEISFEDNGPGVPDSELANIFELFYRTDSARSNTGQGSGVGLAIVKEIIEAHQGEICALPGQGRQGLCIRMTLPLAAQEQGEKDTDEKNTDCRG